MPDTRTLVQIQRPTRTEGQANMMAPVANRPSDSVGSTPSLLNLGLSSAEGRLASEGCGSTPAGYCKEAVLGI